MKSNSRICRVTDRLHHNLPLSINGEERITVLDLGSRRVVGYAQGERMTVGLTISALERAINMRHPEKGLICHSGRGAQYTCSRYQKIITDNGFISSMSKPGTPYDNACAESFFATLDKNLLALKGLKQGKKHVMKYGLT